MKKQNGFISSSSSVATTYSTVNTFSSWESAGQVYDHTSVKNWSTTSAGSPYSIMTQSYSSYDSEQSYSWNTFESTCYERIEYFLEANERLGEPYSKASFYYQNLVNYDSSVALENIYNGFVDLVITMPCDIRLTGIELINPWVSERFDSSYSDYWRYLPVRFNIYKVDTDSLLEDGIENVTYENSVANYKKFDDTKMLRAVRYDDIENDSNMILLGSYKDISWKGKSSYKCFFKYNSNDVISQNATANSNSTGTAVWSCKQLVIRIFETKVNLNHLNSIIPGKNYTYIEKMIFEYILQKEIEYGTTYAGLTPTIDQISALFGKTNISSAYKFEDEGSNNSETKIYDKNWKFGSQFIRSYNTIR